MLCSQDYVLIVNKYPNRGFSRHCAHSIAQVVTTMAVMLDIFLCSITRKRIAEKIQHGGCRDDSW